MIAMGTAVALSHNMFDAALLSGHLRQDRARAVDRRAQLRSPAAVFVPGRPDAIGLPNKEKLRIRQLYAEGKVGRDELLEAEARPTTAPAPAPSTAPPTATRC